MISQLRGATEVWCSQFHLQPEPDIGLSEHAPPKPQPVKAGRPKTYSNYLPRRDGRLSWPKCLITPGPGILSDHIAYICLATLQTSITI